MPGLSAVSGCAGLDWFLFQLSRMCIGREEHSISSQDVHGEKYCPNCGGVLMADLCRADWYVEKKGGQADEYRDSFADS